MEEEKFVHHMGLHEVVFGANFTKVLRVPGGWIYFDSNKTNRSGVFVPYNEEFKEDENE